LCAIISQNKSFVNPFFHKSPILNLIGEKRCTERAQSQVQLFIMILALSLAKKGVAPSATEIMIDILGILG
jgi:hypothetical protein